jgi:hypothetical protein
MATLINLQGGPQNFVDRLDFIIDNVRNATSTPNAMKYFSPNLQGYFDVTDEPGQQIPYMYHYANRPDKSTQRSRQTIGKFFNTTVQGLPGNDGKYLINRSPCIFLFARLLRQRRHGQLRGLPPRRIVPRASNTTISALLAVLSEGVVLQPAVQHEYNYPHEELFAAGNIH